MSREIETARHRLEVFHADQLDAEITNRERATCKELRAIRTVLDEIHRLNVAVSNQRQTIETMLAAKNRPHKKPAQPRSRPARTGSTTPKGEKRK